MIPGVWLFNLISADPGSVRSLRTKLISTDMPCGARTRYNEALPARTRVLFRLAHLSPERLAFANVFENCRVPWLQVEPLWLRRPSLPADAFMDTIVRVVGLINQLDKLGELNRQVGFDSLQGCDLPLFIEGGKPTFYPGCDIK